MLLQTALLLCLADIFSSAVAVAWQRMRQMGFWLRLWALCAQVKIHPTDMAARTVNQVNSDAPTYTAPSVRFFRARQVG